MEMRSAKLLDETCNSNNEAYGDEVFYGAWLAAAHAAAEYEVVEAPQPGRADISTFLAGLGACRTAITH